LAAPRRRRERTKVDSLIKPVERMVVGIGILAACLLVPLVLAITWEVFSRYALGEPTIWAYEIGYTLTGSHFLLALAYTLRAGEHIRIDVLSHRLPGAVKRWIDATVYALLLPLLAWVAYTLWHYMAGSYASGETSGQSALNLPVWPFRLVLFIAFATLVLQVLAELLKALRPATQPQVVSLAQAQHA
jgi:TRAP-type mannitol/chloroaromatic compound transport system permease small subunit